MIPKVLFSISEPTYERGFGRGIKTSPRRVAGLAIDLAELQTGEWYLNFEAFKLPVDLVTNLVIKPNGRISRFFFYFDHTVVAHSRSCHRVLVVDPSRC